MRPMGLSESQAQRDAEAQRDAVEKPEPAVFRLRTIAEFPPVGPATQTGCESIDSTSEGMGAWPNPCAVMQGMCRNFAFCCVLDNKADVSAFTHRVTTMAAEGMVAKGVESLGTNHSGLPCCLRSLQRDDVWFEREARLDGEGDLECHVEVFDVDYQAGMVHTTPRSQNCDGAYNNLYILKPVVADVQNMEVRLQELASEGWSLRTVFQSPSKQASKDSGEWCCTSFYKTQYLAALYRKKNAANPGKRLTAVVVECPGNEQYRFVHDKKNSHYEFEQREIDLTPLENAIHEGYARGARLVTAVNVAGQTAGQAERQEVTRLFYLFFEEYEVPSLNMPHVAIVARVSRRRHFYNSKGTCFPSSRFDSENVRRMWRMAGQSGWQVADLIETGGVTAQGRGTGKFDEECMMVFEAPLAAAQESGQTQQGLLGNLAQPLQGGQDLATDDQPDSQIGEATPLLDDQPAPVYAE